VTGSRNIQSEIIPKISTGFCGGITRTCGICGAVSGAIMAISLFYGRSSPSEPIDESYIPVKKMIEMLEDRFGTTNCKQLIGIDLSNEEGRKRWGSPEERHLTMGVKLDIDFFLNGCILNLNSWYNALIGTPWTSLLSVHWHRRPVCLYSHHGKGHLRWRKNRNRFET